MLRASESDETEILLGNKQLLGIFFVVALLLAVAFYGGYMVGRGGTARRLSAPAAAHEEAQTNQSTGGGGETHVVGAGAGTAAEPNNARGDSDAKSSAADEPLGTSKRKTSARSEPPETDSSGSSASEAFAPQVGQQFLQVVAVSRDEAEAVADVLHKKGFRAHAVPKPGNAKIYRVIIGPIRDTADLSSTREALMRTGFREVILQRY